MGRPPVLRPQLRRDSLGSACRMDMSPTFQHTLLALVGVLSGLAAHRFSGAVRGSLKKHVLLGSVVESIAAAPGIILAMLFLNRRGPSVNLFVMLGLVGAFVLPYAVTRIGVYRFSASRSARRSGVLPFIHWFELLRTNPRAASHFLTTYLAEYEGGGADPLPGLRAACASLEQTKAADSLLPAALAALRVEITRLEVARGRLSGSANHQDALPN